ncbi:expressed protein [Phakopsora pachyrhizi]|uniref:Expressed protein n=1 Tax=Phakopsora pachyrhizi TaxID=170000 RepID=A0AAV0B7R9_PHAPC|nr:expressed protein [Phakopsora pachyrhizi]CAH7682028.1 expressed protein [Phakopsora pachyrhizi]
MGCARIFRLILFYTSSVKFSVICLQGFTITKIAMRLTYIFIFHHFVSLPVRARFEAFDYPSAEYRIAGVGQNSFALDSHQAENYNHAPTLGNDYENFYNHIGQPYWSEISVNEPYFKPVGLHLDKGNLNHQPRPELENDSNINFDQNDWSQTIDTNEHSGILNPEESIFYTSTDFPRFESAPPARSDEQDFVSNLGSGNLDSIFDGLPEVSGVFDDPMFYSDQNPHPHYGVSGHTSTVDDAQVNIGSNIHPAFNEAQNMIDQSFGLTSYSPYDFPHHQGSDCSSSFEWAQNYMNPTNVPMDNSITNSEAKDFGQNVPPYPHFIFPPAGEGISQESGPFKEHPTVTPYQEVGQKSSQDLNQIITKSPFVNPGPKRNDFGSKMNIDVLSKKCDIEKQKMKFQAYEEAFLQVKFIQQMGKIVDTRVRSEYKLIHDLIYTLQDQTLMQFYSKIHQIAEKIKLPPSVEQPNKRYIIRHWDYEFRNYIYETSMIMIAQLKICVKHFKFLEIDVDGNGTTQKFKVVDEDDVAKFLKLFWETYVEFAEKDYEEVMAEEDRDKDYSSIVFEDDHNIENTFKKIQPKILRPSSPETRVFISNHVLFAYFRKKLTHSSWKKISTAGEIIPWKKGFIRLINEAVLVEFIEYFSKIS